MGGFSGNDAAIAGAVSQGAAAAKNNSGFQAIERSTQMNNAWSAKEAAGLRDWQQIQNQKAMEFNSSEAAKNRDWQKMMSDTAHQREMKDLVKAGLNPILTATGGNGAATTSGATASGVTSQGAKGDTDTSGTMALVNLLGTLVGSYTQLENMRVSAETNLAVADKYNAMAKYTSELGHDASIYASDASITSAGIHAAATKYAADKNASTQITIAGIQQATAKYGVDIGRMSQMEIAKFNAEVNKYLQERGQQHDFDIRKMYPSNAWEADPGQANSRAWMDSISGGLRDIGIGLNSGSGLFANSGKTNIIGFR